MSYTKTTWETGDVITAEKLNNIENELEALDDSVFIVNIDAEDNSGTITATADKTRQEMSAAVEAEKPIIIRLIHNMTYAPSSIHELTTNIWTSTLANGYDFTAEKIIGINNSAKSISTAKVDVQGNNDTDTITVSFPTYSFT